MDNHLRPFTKQFRSPRGQFWAHGDVMLSHLLTSFCFCLWLSLSALEEVIKAICLGPLKAKLIN